VYGGNLIAGGVFTSANGVSANHIAQYDGTKWSSMGAGVGSSFVGCVYAFTSLNGYLYVGGNFTNAGSTATNYIAGWKGPNGVITLQENSSVNVYPNPTGGILTVSEQNISGNTEIELFNLLGEKLSESKLSLNSNTEINIANQPTGIYFYKVIDENNNTISEGKLIKE